MSAAAVGCDGLAVGYGGRAVVEGLSLEVAPGATLAVLGTNGSGKSTLVKTIAGLLAPVAGSVRVLGGRPGAAPARVAYLGQAQPTGFVLPLRAVDVVAMGRFPARGLVGRMTAEDRRAGATTAWRGWASPTWPTRRSGACRAASASACTWPAASPGGPTC